MMMRTPRSIGLLALATILAAAGLAACSKPAAKPAAPATPAVAHSEAGKIQRMKYQGADRYLTVEVLADDLLHFELAAGTGPAADKAIPTTPMVARTDYPGPTSFTEKDNTFETAALKVTIDTEKLCVTTFDKQKNVTLTTTCPTAVTGTWKGLTLTPEKMQNVYGLGEQFSAPNMPDGDWVGRQRTSGIYGNVMAGFNGGSAANAQFPIMYAVGPDSTNYALFLDDISGQKWDFRANPWKTEASGDAVRWFLMAGPSLTDLRQDYMALTGRPPVPPKQMFGLWVSEYGYENWGELDSKLKTLRSAGFPLDGAVLDLQWFGGINGSSDQTNMGRLTWDTDKFPNPGAKIAAYRRNDGIGIMTIEESYIGRGLPEWVDLANRGFLVKQANGDPAYLTQNPWWGKGGMLDWTNPKAGDYWHDEKRQPLIDQGVMGHWTDLGEPEMYDPKDAVAGIVPGKTTHADYHNLYNFLWAESIARGYQRNQVQQRPFILSRSGAPGIQRFGTAMWSGDVGSNLTTLATQFNVQMMMSMSGVDYFGSDIGGFHREGLTPGLDLNEMYTQWFAAGMLLDVPGRPHTENLCNCKETAPDRIGSVASNLANVRQRYELIPYVYSLAHRAYQFGEPVFPPAAYYYQDDQNLRKSGSEKMLGRDLLAGVVAEAGKQSMKLYLPAGAWVDYHTNKWYQGGKAIDVPLQTNGIYHLPLFARAGAIIPRMYVDQKTMNALGMRSDGSVHDELIARIYPAEQASAFTLYEDDGVTIAYQKGALRTTEIAQQKAGKLVTVTVKAANGEYAGAPVTRNNVVELVTDGAHATGVTMNGASLQQLSSRAAFDAAEAGWYDAGDNLVLAKSGNVSVTAVKSFGFTLDK